MEHLIYDNLWQHEALVYKIEFGGPRNSSFPFFKFYYKTIISFFNLFSLTYGFQSKCLVYFFINFMNILRIYM